MSIGVRCHDYGCASPAEIARRVSDAGFQAAQVALNKCIEGAACTAEYGHLSPGFCRNVRNAFESRNVEIAVVGCYIDVASPDEKVRLAGVKRYQEALLYCRQLGSNIVGTETSNCKEPERREQYKRLVRSVEVMAEQAEHAGVFCGIEPVLVHTLNTPELAKQLLDDIGSLNVQIILDPINLLCPENLKDQRSIIDRAFDCFGDRIVAVHAKDRQLSADGKFVPCVIGEGLFDQQYFFDQLKQAKPGITVLREECDPRYADKDIKALRSYLGIPEYVRA